MDKENAGASKHLVADEKKSPLVDKDFLNSKSHENLAGEGNSNNASKEDGVPSEVDNGEETVKESKIKQEGHNKKKKNNYVLIFVAVALVLVVVGGYFLLLPSSEYKFSFNINNVNFVSNEFTPSIFFPEFKKNSTFYLSIDLKKGEDNQWLINSSNLWIIALNYDKKKVITLIREVDAGGTASLCMTNDGNVLLAREMPLAECESVLSNKNNSIVSIRFGDKDRVILSKNKVEVIASGNKTISHVNYYVIKEMYSDFDTILALVNERISGIN